MTWGVVSIGMLVMFFLGVWYLVQQVSTPNFGVGCLFPEDSIGSFGSDPRRGFFGEGYVSERSERSCIEES